MKEIILSHDQQVSFNYLCRMHGIDPKQGFTLKHNAEGKWIIEPHDPPKAKKGGK